MSHKNLNSVTPSKQKRVAIVIANPAVSKTTGWPVGFWWSELTHPFYKFSEKGYEVEIFSPQGGKCEADAMSNPDDVTQWQKEDLISRGFIGDPDLMKLVENTKVVDEIEVNRFDAIVVAGGQAPMFSYGKAENLHKSLLSFMSQEKLLQRFAMEQQF
jgi:putative intracellular protease/amidase